MEIWQLAAPCQYGILYAAKSGRSESLFSFRIRESNSLIPAFNSLFRLQGESSVLGYISLN
jgi:hypothetical protein